MSSDYKQCKLVKKTETGTKELVSWIPLKFAKKTKVLKLQDPKTKEWEDGWADYEYERYRDRQLDDQFLILENERY